MINNNNIKLKDILIKLEKSSIKAGNGKSKGKYPLYTCSSVLSKYYDDYLYDEEALIVGTGGSPAINYCNGKFCTSTDCWTFISNDKYEIKYIYYLLLSKMNELQEMFRGAGLKHLNREAFMNIQVRTLEINDQRIIIENLDRIQEIIDIRKHQIEDLDVLIKARFVELFGNPVTNPFGWRKLTIQQAIDENIIDKPLDGNHGGKHPKTSDYVPSGIPFIMANNLVEGKVDLENCAFISREQADSLDKGFAKEGDVLITHKGTIGRTAVLHCSYPYIMLTPQVTYYRPKTGIIPEYLKAYFDTEYFQGIIGNIASVGSTRAYIGITAQQELPLIVPPMKVQNQFAAFVEQTDKSKLELQKSLEEMQNLFDSLMTEYFG